MTVDFNDEWYPAIVLAFHVANYVFLLDNNEVVCNPNQWCVEVKVFAMQVDQEKLLTVQASVWEWGYADKAPFLMCYISLNVVFLL